MPLDKGVGMGYCQFCGRMHHANSRIARQHERRLKMRGGLQDANRNAGM